MNIICLNLRKKQVDETIMLSTLKANLANPSQCRLRPLFWNQSPGHPVCPFKKAKWHPK